MAAAAVVVVNGSYRAKLLAWWLASMRMCAYMCVCVYVCMYVCVYVCARMFERGAPGPGLAWPGLAWPGRLLLAGLSAVTLVVAWRIPSAGHLLCVRFRPRLRSKGVEQRTESVFVSM